MSHLQLHVRTSSLETTAAPPSFHSVCVCVRLLPLLLLPLPPYTQMHTPPFAFQDTTNNERERIDGAPERGAGLKNLRRGAAGYRGTIKLQHVEGSTRGRLAHIDAKQGPGDIPAHKAGRQVQQAYAYYRQQEQVLTAQEGQHQEP